jgi:hypothetical protein
MGDAALTWWLFVRGEESTRVEVVSPRLVVIKGPGGRADALDCKDEQSLLALALSLEDWLRDTGWNLLGFEAERRTCADRRAQRRSTDDRRRTASSR